MEETSPFPNALARVTRTRSMETVVSVPMPHVVAGSQEHPLPLQGQAELDELRMQNVERAAASSSPFNTMTYEQLAQFHAQQEAAMASRLEQESARQAVMAAEIEKSRREQEESRAILLQQQQQLQRQQEKLKLATAQQAKVTGDHQSLLQQGSEAMRQQHSKPAANQRPPLQAAPTAIGRPETIMGVQQVPLAPMYKGSTKRERREFMDEYLAYSRRVEALNRG
ncbi:unnamed protein product, partial [Aphanomyces euteiches]